MEESSMTFSVLLVLGKTSAADRIRPGSKGEEGGCRIVREAGEVVDVIV